MYNPVVNKNKFSALLIFLILIPMKLFAHNENSMEQKIYESRLRSLWEQYEESADLNQKILILEKMESTASDANSITPVTQMRNKQEEIIKSLIDSIKNMKEELMSPEKNLERQKHLEKQIQKNIFSCLEFEKTISDFKSNQFWKISKIFLLILVIFIISTIILTFNYNNAKQRNKRQQEFNRKMIQVQEEERKRLSRELHDTVTQDIRTSLLYVRDLMEKENIHDQEGKELASKIEQLESQNLINIRNIIRNLTPPEIENSDLRNLLNEYSCSITKSSGIKCTFFAEDDIDFKRFNNVQKLNIFRIIQEAVNNSIKHADATEINLLVRKKSSSSQTLIFFISDDGQGFNSSKNKFSDTEDLLAQSTHLGLAGMNNRAQLINAKLDIYSDEDCGTEIRFEI